MRLIVSRCEVRYTGRSTTYQPGGSAVAIAASFLPGNPPLIILW